MWSVECGVWSVEPSVKSQVRSVERGVYGVYGLHGLHGLYGLYGLYGAYGAYGV